MPSSVVREVVDLTGGDDSEDTAFGNERPAKRARVGEVIPSYLPRNLNAANIAPYLRQAIQTVHDPFVNSQQLISTLESRLLQDRQLQNIHARDGYVSQELGNLLSLRAKTFAKQLSLLPDYRLSAQPENAYPRPLSSSALPAPQSAPQPASLPTATFPPVAINNVLRYQTPQAVPYVSAPAVSGTSASFPSPGPASFASTRSPSSSIRPRTPKANKEQRDPKAIPTTPQNFRTRAHAAWRATISESRGSGGKIPSYFAFKRRPYLAAEEKNEILRGSRRLVKANARLLQQQPNVFHIDFTSEETRLLQKGIRLILKRPADHSDKDPSKDLAKIVKKNRDNILWLASSLCKSQNAIPGRSAEDIQHFLTDLIDKNVSQNPQILSLENDPFDKHGQDERASRVPSLLLAREISGNKGFGMRRYENFANEFRKCRENNLELRAEYTNCAGDISTVSWVSNQGYICGTTAHMDSHNQQYNKPGNLVLGSVPKSCLRAYADHRIPRPVVEKGENSTEAMRESQEPWLYCSVVSSDYDPIHDRTYTSGFDRTVKAWKVDKDGASMTLLGTWHHGGNVNFVQASRHHSGLVATAADVPEQAVRIYHVNEQDISQSYYTPLSCSRILDHEGRPMITDKWAYFPSTMRWALHKEARHLLLVGYSPRSLTTDDNDIPADKVDSGELCLWDGLTGERVRITSAASQNVFEVVWHPTQVCFAVASSPTGLNVDDGVRTQIRVFTPHKDTESLAFSEVKTLDCPALDINELTIMPNSYFYCYITAGCTDGRTYVWDTARGDKPVHALRHGKPTEEMGELQDREREDTGVKFTAWGTSMDRFYTGSSDGLVKVWNVRSRGRSPLVRVLLEAPAQISYGAFSPDHSRLVVGDASGRVFVLTVDDDEDKPARFVDLRLPGGAHTTRRRPNPITPHPEPPHPEPPPPPPPPPPPSLDGGIGIGIGISSQAETGAARAHNFLATGQLQLHKDPTIGAVQGPNYAETNLFRAEAHADRFSPSTSGLQASFQCEQQEERKLFAPSTVRPDARSRFRTLRALEEDEHLAEKHEQNTSLDLDLSKLEIDTLRELESEGAEMGETEFDFEYENDGPDGNDEDGGDNEDVKMSE